MIKFYQGLLCFSESSPSLWAAPNLSPLYVHSGPGDPELLGWGGVWGLEPVRLQCPLTIAGVSLAAGTVWLFLGLPRQ